MAITRRALLGTVGTVAGAAVGLVPGPSDATAEDSTPRVKLRLLETSDLHMFVLDWDYYQVKPDPTVGFAKVASLIRAARAENPNTLLFDNGDFIQGNPLADYVATQRVPTSGAPHPIVAIMGDLGYDAATLGNHEFNYGLAFLEASLAGAAFPFVLANVTRVGGAEFLPPHIVLERKVADESGMEHSLRIGVIGFVPPQIMAWDKVNLDGRLEAADIVTTARRLVPGLRARCDVMVALCHSGINGGPYVEGQEHAALHLARVAGFDAIFTGHSHKVFPGKDYMNVEGVDADAGRLAGVPSVMPGYWGSHLGLIDLTLRRTGNAWSVETATVEARPIARRDQGKVESLATVDAAVVAAITPAHEGTLAWVEQPAGISDGPLHSYFVWAGYDPATALVNAAQTWYARPLLAGTPFADLPLLSSAAPYRVGYTPDGFIDIPAGPVALRQVADLYLYSSNTVVALQMTGAQILEWLEFSTRIFNTIDPAVPGPHQLVAKGIPSYTFDTISGLTYQIDVTKPPRYDQKGIQVSDTRRVVDLAHDGQAINPAQPFVVITNNYRADGRATVPGLSGASIALRAPDANRDAVMKYFKAQATVPVPTAMPWSFAPIGRLTTVWFDSGKPAAAHISRRANLSVLGDGEPGYTRIAMTLD
jgi:2',3'-cyclic-nucleotide 2'-phosphodiesterase / 3'-nucleotidase